MQEASRLEPDDPRTHYELGGALRQVGKVDKAQEEFKLSQKLYAAHRQEQCESFGEHNPF